LDDFRQNKSNFWVLPFFKRFWEYESLLTLVFQFIFIKLKHFIQKMLIQIVPSTFDNEWLGLKWIFSVLSSKNSAYNTKTNFWNVHPYTFQWYFNRLKIALKSWFNSLFIRTTCFAVENRIFKLWTSLQRTNIRRT